MPSFDITLLTDARYIATETESPFIRNILHEDRIVRTAFEKKGLRVHRINWDHPEMDWSDTSFVLFRSTWDYMDRIPEFEKWLARVSKQTSMLNPYEIIRWNMDKHYLTDLSSQGINIPPTRFLEIGEQRSLNELVRESDWQDIVLKPVVSAGARHTYRFTPNGTAEYEPIFRTLLQTESLMIQEFQEQVTSRGEVSFIVIDGKFTHAILKKAKTGDFRVQDDFGGTVYPYDPIQEDISWAEAVVSSCDPLPLYARVDAIWDNHNRQALSELELIEPELWFRFQAEAADRLANAFIKNYT